MLQIRHQNGKQREEGASKCRRRKRDGEAGQRRKGSEREGGRGRQRESEGGQGGEGRGKRVIPSFHSRVAKLT